MATLTAARGARADLRFTTQDLNRIRSYDRSEEINSTEPPTKLTLGYDADNRGEVATVTLTGQFEIDVEQRKVTGGIVDRVDFLDRGDVMQPPNQWTYTTISRPVRPLDRALRTDDFKAQVRLLLNGNDAITGGALNDELIGFDGADKINGLGGNDYLAGGLGADRLEGARGSDVLLGGAGVDVLVGGPDADRFAFTSLADLGPGAARTDTILDYSQQDQIQLGLDANARRGGFQAPRLVESFSGVAGEMIGVETRDSTRLVIDRNGDRRGDAVLVVKFGNGPVLEAEQLNISFTQDASLLF